MDRNVFSLEESSCSFSGLSVSDLMLAAEDIIVLARRTDRRALQVVIASSWLQEKKMERNVNKV